MKEKHYNPAHFVKKYLPDYKERMDIAISDLKKLVNKHTTCELSEEEKGYLRDRMVDMYFPEAIEAFVKAQREECFKEWLKSPSPYTFKTLIKDEGTAYYTTIRDYILNAPMPKPINNNKT